MAEKGKLSAGIQVPLPLAEMEHQAETQLRDSLGGLAIFLRTEGVGGGLKRDRRHMDGLLLVEYHSNWKMKFFTTVSCRIKNEIQCCPIELRMFQ